MQPHHRIEALESRIAPAAIFTFPDVDGDIVKIFSDKTLTVTGDSTALVVSGSGMDGASFSTTVLRGAGGDGLVNLGRIVAMGLDLGAVTVKGDLGKIVAGNNASPLPGVKSLTARSMGVFGVATQGSGDLVTDITGDLGKLNIAGDVIGAQIKVGGKIGEVKIGGDLQGTNVAFGGRIQAAGAGNITIGGDVATGSADESGKLVFTGSIGALKIGGDLVGARDATNDPAGQVYVFGSAGAISIRGGIYGGVSQELALDIHGNTGAITIGGSIHGDIADGSAGITILGSTGAIKIGGSIFGGDGVNSARVKISGNTGAITIGGSLEGRGQGTATLAILGNIGALKIGGSVVNSTGRGSGTILIGGKGAGLSIGGDIVGATGGVDLTAGGQVTYNGDVNGPVKIGGSLLASTGLGGGSAVLGDATSVFLGGSIIGGGEYISPQMVAFPAGSLTLGTAKTVTIAGDIVESPFRGGSLQVHGAANLIIGGSIFGASSLDPLAISGSQVQLSGTFGTVKVLGSIVGSSNMGGGTFGASLDVDGSVASLTVGGSLVGGNVNFGGSVDISGNAGMVKILGSLSGGTGAVTAGLRVGGKLDSLTIGGSVSALSGNYSTYNGQIVAAKMGAVKIGGDLLTAGGGAPSRIHSNSDIASIQIGGDMNSVIEGLTIGPVKIRGDLVAPGGSTFGGINAQKLASLAVGGDVRSFAPGICAAINIARSTGPITIGGDFRATESGVVRLISGGTPDAAPAFSSIKIKGSMVGAQILAGYTLGLATTNEDASIGAVTVGRDFTASSIVAGIKTGMDMYFGTNDDAAIANATSTLARIAAVTVKGQVFGTAAMNDHFGIVAQKIGAVSVGGHSITNRPADLGLTGDTTVRVI